jgi:foldase protein PrsA
MRTFMQGPRLRLAMLLLAVIMTIAIVYGMISPGMRGADQDHQSGSARSIIATINDEKVDSDALDKLADQQEKQMEQYGQQPPSAMMMGMIRGEAFKRLVDQTLVLQAAKREGIKVSGRDVNNEIDKIVASQIEMVKGKLFPNHKGPITDAEVNKAIGRAHPGSTLNSVKDEIRQSISTNDLHDQLMIQRLVDKLVSGIDSSPKAIRASYDSAKYSQITIKTDKRSAADAEKLATDLVAKIRGGQDFASVAKEHSEDPSAKSGGAQTMFMPKRYIQKPIADVIFKLKPGEVSDPVKTDEGIMILRLDGIKNTAPADLSDPKKERQYKDTFLNDAKREIAEKYLDGLHKSAKIDIKDHELKAISMQQDIYAAATPDLRKSKAELAIKELQRALVDKDNEQRGEVIARINAELGSLYVMLAAPGPISISSKDQKDYHEKAKASYEAALKKIEDSDIRLSLARLYIDDKQYDKALQSLDIVSKNSYADPGPHQQILQMYQQMKSAPNIDALIAKTKGAPTIDALIAKEKAWQDDYNKRMKASQPAGSPTSPQTVTIPAPSAGKSK